MTFRKKFQKYSRALRKRTFGIPYGDLWQEKDAKKWYSDTENIHPLIHKDFLNYLSNKKDIKSVLEIGCGPGVYPIMHKNIFEKFDYTGIDISKSAIKFCQENSDFNFICGDFQKMELEDKYDLIFSQGVIHHVYNINAFLSKIVEISKKYAYILSSLGYSNELEDHKMEWSEKQAIYNSILSSKQVTSTLIECGLKENQFSIGHSETDSENSTGTLIEINKTV